MSLRFARDEFELTFPRTRFVAAKVDGWEMRWRNALVPGDLFSTGQVLDKSVGIRKTLAAVMPASLHALTGRGVHVVTFNDYLARRDAQWMCPIYRMVGVSVGFVQQGMSSEERRRAYLKDVTYVTAKEAGFDYLRDLLATNPSQVVHRRFHCALVDEADSLLIDEARIPLVIAGSFDHEQRPVENGIGLVACFIGEK